MAHCLAEITTSLEAIAARHPRATDGDADGDEPGGRTLASARARLRTEAAVAVDGPALREVVDRLQIAFADLHDAIATAHFGVGPPAGASRRRVAQSPSSQSHDPRRERDGAGARVRVWTATAPRPDASTSSPMLAAAPGPRGPRCSTSWRRSGPGELRARRELADRLVVAEGAGYLVHEEAPNASSWRIDPVPLILPAAEWRTIERGLVQRAELLEAVLDDLTGPRHLLRGGLLPPARRPRAPRLPARPRTASAVPDGRGWWPTAPTSSATRPAATACCATRPTSPWAPGTRC